jgi:methylated-DNA-[protein]-cysteine S-methyltransferase
MAHVRHAPPLVHPVTELWKGTTMRARTTIESPIGPLTLIATDTAVVGILFHGQQPDDCEVLQRGDHPILDRMAQQLDEYFAGTRMDFDLPLDFEGTAFQQTAWNALCSIPYGETISYGEQARRLGDKNKSRAVGAANGQNPIPIVVPCHRVVGSNGHLTGFGGGLETKAWLLDHEFRVRAQAST